MSKHDNLITFHNPGEIDIRGATVAGLSAKDGKSPIGFFGTGLKYSIASILRMGGSITIYAGLSSYTFRAEQIDFRGESHQQVIMDYTVTGCMGDVASGTEKLGFTTHYGTNWEPWMIFRELYSNALDEDGSVQLGDYPPTDGRTTIVVDCAEIAEQYAKRNSIILPKSRKPIESNATIEVLDAQADYLYYRGVRVRKQISRFTWNHIAKLKLTEDRSLAYTWDFMSNAAQLVQGSEDSSFIRKVLTAGDSFIEYNLRGSFSAWYPTSAAFIAVVVELYKKWPEKYSDLRPIIAKNQPEVLAVASKQLTGLQQKMLNKAARLVTEMGHPIEASAVIVADLGANILGKYEDDQVYLSPTVFDQGTKQVVSTLLEECVHRDTGKADCNYDMQTYLFNRIVSLYEEHVFGEPI